MTGRYLADVEPYRSRVPTFLQGDGVVVRLTPERLRAWSFHDWNWEAL